MRIVLLFPVLLLLAACQTSRLEQNDLVTIDMPEVSRFGGIVIGNAPVGNASFLATRSMNVFKNGVLERSSHMESRGRISMPTSGDGRTLEFQEESVDIKDKDGRALKTDEFYYRELFSQVLLLMSGNRPEIAFVYDDGIDHEEFLNEGRNQPINGNLQFLSNKNEANGFVSYVNQKNNQKTIYNIKNLNDPALPFFIRWVSEYYFPGKDVGYWDVVGPSRNLTSTGGDAEFLLRTFGDRQTRIIGRAGWRGRDVIVLQFRASLAIPPSKSFKQLCVCLIEVRTGALVKADSVWLLKGGEDQTEWRFSLALDRN